MSLAKQNRICEVLTPATVSPRIKKERLRAHQDPQDRGGLLQIHHCGVNSTVELTLRLMFPWTEQITRWSMPPRKIWNVSRLHYDAARGSVKLLLPHWML